VHIDKDLVAASATPLVLGILAEGDLYGYAILKRVGDLSGGRMQWTDGMLAVLHRLERNGWVRPSGAVESGGNASTTG
jgi:DNA-binding PadR family transcriptional regulator